MGLIENFQRERVRDVPLREAVKVSPDLSVSAAVELMQEKQLGCAVVVDDQDRPLGIFTERTVIDLLLQQSGDMDAISVKDHLDPNWSCVREDDPLSTLVEAVQDKGARFLCVTDADGRVIALTGQKGLAEYVADHFPRQVMVQRLGGKPGTVEREGA
ncbi:MAG: CBS domain-containing protein [Planctomycetes bacterium]|nr:CBS domain-containing protein [Planctomycetota bacterium]